MNGRRGLTPELPYSDPIMLGRPYSAANSNSSTLLGRPYDVNKQRLAKIRADDECWHVIAKLPVSSQEDYGISWVALRSSCTLTAAAQLGSRGGSQARSRKLAAPNAKRANQRRRQMAR